MGASDGPSEMRPRWALAAIGTVLSACLFVAGCDDRRAPRPQGPDETVAPTEGERAQAPVSRTLAAVRARGRLNCGVHQGLVGCAYTDNRGQWRGFDVDFCRALAAAVLGDAAAVRFVPLSAAQRFDALNDGQIDVLWRNTSWTLSHEAGGAFAFAGVNYYDGQGFMVRRDLDVRSATELNGARICVQAGANSRSNMEDYFRQHGLAFETVERPTEEATRLAYSREECDVLTADLSALAAARTTLANPQSHMILPDVISKEAMGPATRADDPAWTGIVRWTLNALILAEELGVSQANAETLAESSQDVRVRRLLGAEGNLGTQFGLSDAWAMHAIMAAGNYGEIFDQNLGQRSPLDLARGLNGQWNAQPAGRMYGLPVR